MTEGQYLYDVRTGWGEVGLKKQTISVHDGGCPKIGNICGRHIRIAPEDGPISNFFWTLLIHIFIMTRGNE